MVDRVPFKIFEPLSDSVGTQRLTYVAAVAQIEDAAYLVSFRDTGTEIRWGMRPTVGEVDRVLYTVTDDQNRNTVSEICKLVRRAIAARHLLSAEADMSITTMLGDISRNPQSQRRR